MTLTLAVDASNDIVVSAAGSLELLTDAPAVLQGTLHAARVRRTECVLDFPRGIPFETTAWAGIPDVRRYEAALRQQLLAVEGVTGIMSLVVRRQGDNLRYSTTLRTIYGPVTLNV